MVELRPTPDGGTPTSTMELFEGGAPAPNPERCRLDEAYFARQKVCSSDADCTVFTHQPACCSHRLVVGVATETLEAVETCAETNKLLCNCEPGLTRTEKDGRVVNDLSQATVQCINQRCTSLVTERPCGASRVCSQSEICVTYENVPGGIPPDPDSLDNAYLTFRCEPNPCQGQLACACAQPLCDARNDAVRGCEIKNNEESDLTCRPFVD